MNHLDRSTPNLGSVAMHLDTERDIRMPAIQKNTSRSIIYIKTRYPKLLEYLQKIGHPDAHDIDFQERYLNQLAINPHQCLPLRDAIHRSANQQNLDPQHCTHTNLTPLQQTSEGKWVGDSIPSRFIIENDQYPRFLVSLVADWSRPQGGILHSIQECVRSEDLIHVYLDLDSNSTPITNHDVNTIVETTLGVINQYFDTRHILTRPEVIILRNQGSSQYKVHVHIPELTLAKKHLKYVVEKAKGILPLLAEFIDTNYSGCRMVLTKKKDNKNSVYYDPQYPPWGGADPEEQLLLLLKTKVRAWKGEQPLMLKPHYTHMLQEIHTARIENSNITTEIQHRMSRYIDHSQFNAS